MIYAALIFQVIALLCLLMFVPMWSGRSTSWLEGRRGWPPMLFGWAFAMFQGFTLTALLFPDGHGNRILHVPVLEGLAAVWLLLSIPLPFVGIFWLPRFVLPGWIRERLRAGDPVRTARPVPEVRDLMTKKPNLVQEDELTEGFLELPTRVRVRRGRWVFSSLLGVVLSVVMVCVVLGVPAEVFEDPSAMMVFLRVAAVAGVVLAVWASVVFIRLTVFPEDVAFDAEGLSTRSFSLSWEDIRGAGVQGDPSSVKAQVVIEVVPEAFVRVAAPNRWLSGRPVGIGGLAARDGVVRLQPALEVPGSVVVGLIERHRPQWHPTDHLHWMDQPPQP